MKLYTIILFFCLSWCFSQNGLDPKQFAATITAKELKESLYVYASDYFQGRETGKIGQKRAIDFLQNFYSSIGIPPAEGTENYLQKININVCRNYFKIKTIFCFFIDIRYINFIFIYKYILNSILKMKMKFIIINEVC